MVTLGCPNIEQTPQKVTNELCLCNNSQFLQQDKYHADNLVNPQYDKQ